MGQEGTGAEGRSGDEAELEGFGACPTLWHYEGGSVSSALCPNPQHVHRQERGLP